MYLDLSVLDSDSRVVRLASASNGDPYIKTSYKYEAILPREGHGHWECSSYEYYFDRPIHIEADSFYAGIRVVDNRPPDFDELVDFEDYMLYEIYSLSKNETFYSLSHVAEIGSIRTTVLSTLGNFFPIVKLPCQTPVRPVLAANVPGLAIFNLGEGDHEALQVAIYNDAGDTVLLSDTTSNPRFVFSAAVAERWYEVRVRSACTYTFSGVDTLAFSHWSAPLRFYYTPDTTAIDPADLQPPTSDFLPTIHPNPTTGILNVELGNLNFEGTGATLQLLDLEGRLLQEFEIPNSKFKNPDSEFKIQNSKFKIDITSLPSGTYLVRVVGERQTAVRRLVVQ